MSRIEEIRERIEGCIRARYNQSEGDPEIVEECERARSDLRYLLNHIEAQSEVVEAARSVDAEYHSLPHEKRGNLDRLMARLREALDNLEEQTDD